MNLLKLIAITAILTVWALWCVGGVVEANTLSHTAQRGLVTGECAPIGYAFENGNSIPTNEIHKCRP